MFQKEFGSTAMRKVIGFAAILVLGLPGSGWCQQPSQGQPAPPSQPSAAAQNPPPSAPQPQQDSLAAAARRAREQKKETPKSAKVFDNDNLPPKGVVSTVGQTPEGEEAAPSDQSAPEAAEKPGTDTAKSEKDWRARFAKLRAKLEADETELDLLQREWNQLQLQNYSDPMKTLQQEVTRSDINEKTAKIEAKKQQIEADKQAISDAEDELRKSGGDVGWSR
jgi:chromosome segregation ATPase